MHVLGKVFLGLTIVVAAADAYLATLLVAHRNHWQARIETKQADYVKVHADLLAARKAVHARETELARIQNTWGNQWTAAGGVNNAGNGEMRVAVGAQAGLPSPGAGAPPLAYFLVDNGDGSSRFLGEFQLVEVQPGQALGRLSRPPIGNDATTWPADAQIRVRETIPSAWRSAFIEFYEQYAVAEQKLDFERNQLQIQATQMADSQLLLDQRLAELNGDPNPPQGASQDVVEGLVLTIRREETERNDALETLDALRHEYKRKVLHLNDVVAANKTTVEALPGYPQSIEKPAPRTADVSQR